MLEAGLTSLLSSCGMSQLLQEAPDKQLGSVIPLPIVHATVRPHMTGTGREKESETGRERQRERQREKDREGGREDGK